MRLTERELRVVLATVLRAESESTEQFVDDEDAATYPRVAQKLRDELARRAEKEK